MLKRVRIERLQKEGFSLILSGGAALGTAHIGVLEWLEENSLVPKEIIGSSMGALIGGLYAIGYNSKEILRILEIIEGVDLFKLKFNHGRIEYEKVNELLKKMFKNKRISSTKIPVKVVVTETNTGKAHIFSSQDKVLLADVIKASISIPGIFEPIKIKGNTYMDGGISSNLGVEFAYPKNLKVASNVVNRSFKIGFKESEGFFSSIKGRFVILEGSFHYLLRNQTYAKINYIKKLILIEPDLSSFPVYKLKNYKKMIKIAYEKSKEIIH